MSASHPTSPEPAPATPPEGVPEGAAPPVPAEPGKPRKRLDPVRYGDWEKDGRCIDF